LPGLQSQRVDEARCILVDAGLFSCIGLLRESAYLLAKKKDVAAILPIAEATKTIGNKLAEAGRRELASDISAVRR